MVLLVLLVLVAVLTFGVISTSHWLFVAAVVFAVLWVLSVFAGGVPSRRRSLWW